MKKLFTVLIITLLLSCKNSCDKSVAIFFNPSMAEQTKLHVKVSLHHTIIIDTIIVNSRVDNSVLLKCVNIAPKDFINIEVNEKKRSLFLDSLSQKKGPTSVFIHYDSFIKLHLLFEIYNTKSIRQTGKIPDFRRFVDSLTSNGKNAISYDSVRIYTKKDKCWCGVER